MLNQWDALCYYCDDGLAEPDNNVAERALRAVCLGKKNYIFFGSDHGGERGALLYGLIGTPQQQVRDDPAGLRDDGTDWTGADKHRHVCQRFQSSGEDR